MNIANNFYAYHSSKNRYYVFKDSSWVEEHFDNLTTGTQFRVACNDHVNPHTILELKVVYPSGLMTCDKVGESLNDLPPRRDVTPEAEPEVQDVCADGSEPVEPEVHNVMAWARLQADPATRMKIDWSEDYKSKYANPYEDAIGSLQDLIVGAYAQGSCRAAPLSFKAAQNVVDDDEKWLLGEVRSVLKSLRRQTMSIADADVAVRAAVKKAKEEEADLPPLIGVPVRASLRTERMLTSDHTLTFENISVRTQNGGEQKQEAFVRHIDTELNVGHRSVLLHLNANQELILESVLRSVGITLENIPGPWAGESPTGAFKMMKDGHDLLEEFTDFELRSRR